MIGRSYIKDGKIVKEKDVPYSYESIPAELLISFSGINIDRLKNLVTDYGLSIKEDLQFQLVIPKDDIERIGINIFSVGHTKFDIKEFEALLKSEMGRHPVKYIELTSSETDKIEPFIDLRYE